MRQKGPSAGQAGCEYRVACRTLQNRIMIDVSQPAATCTAHARSIVRNGVQRLAHLDRTAMAALPSWRSPRGVAAARVVSAIAEPRAVGPVLVAAAVIAKRRGGWRAAVLPALAVPSGMVARWLLSEAIARPRPPAEVWLAEPKGYSLPSRHTTLAVLTARALAEAAGLKGPPRRMVPPLAATAVGTSRVYLGLHWPTDVLAGWLFAEGWLALADRTIRASPRTGKVSSQPQARRADG
jgi:membrane-associated phospholipid phosphatase